jgi:hypothetical protein
VKFITQNLKINNYWLSDLSKTLFQTTHQGRASVVHSDKDYAITFLHLRFFSASVENCGKSSTKKRSGYSLRIYNKVISKTAINNFVSQYRQRGLLLKPFTGEGFGGA